MSVSADLVDRSTSQAFITALVTNAGLLAIQVGAFSILKGRMSRIYSPRTFLPPPMYVFIHSETRFYLTDVNSSKRADEFPSGVWRWLPATIKAPTDEIVRVVS
jgi:hypothetical protein